MEIREVKVKWDDLTEAEKEQARESYICIREEEECRNRDELTEKYPYPINSDCVECCKGFYRDLETGYIFVDI